MAHSPSKRWEDGVLVERAISTNLPGEPNPSEGTTNKPYKTPVPTSRNRADREAQAEAEREMQENEAKAVQEAENKAVASAETTTTAKRSRKK